MNYKCGIFAVLISAGAFTGGFFLGENRGKTQRIATLDNEIQWLRDLTASQRSRLGGADQVDWDSWKKLDPITRKHMIIQLWCGDQDAGNYFLGLETGHKWGPVWMRRSPVSILDEQTEVMKGFLADLRKLEEQEGGVSQPKYPPEGTKDPRDGAKIDWENFLKTGDDKNLRAIWYGKNKKTGRWMAYEYDKGVYEPDEELAKRFIDSKKASEKDFEMPEGGEKPKTGESVDPFMLPQVQPDNSSKLNKESH